MTKDEMIQALIGFLKERKKERLVERLQEEKAVQWSKWETLGKIHGLRHAYKLKYEQFKKIEEVQSSGKTPPLEDVKELFSQFVGKQEQTRFFRDVLSEEKKLGEHDAYYEGWLIGIQQVWRDVKGKLDV